MKIEWEEIEDNQPGYLYRSEVPMGWLVKHIDNIMSYTPEMGIEWNRDSRTVICFVLDPEHKWGEEGIWEENNEKEG